MNTTSNENDNRRGASLGTAVGDILAESRTRRVVVRNRAGQQVMDISVLLALILSVGAPVLPAFVVLGVLVQAISVSIEKREANKPAP